MPEKTTKTVLVDNNDKRRCRSRSCRAISAVLIVLIISPLIVINIVSEIHMRHLDNTLKIWYDNVIAAIKNDNNPARFASSLVAVAPNQTDNEDMRFFNDIAIDDSAAVSMIHINGRDVDGRFPCSFDRVSMVYRSNEK